MDQAAEREVQREPGQSQDDQNDCESPQDIGHDVFSSICGTFDFRRHGGLPVGTAECPWAQRTARRQSGLPVRSWGSLQNSFLMGGVWMCSITV
jgi:hypothetical protein